MSLEMKNVFLKTAQQPVLLHLIPEVLPHGKESSPSTMSPMWCQPPFCAPQYANRIQVIISLQTRFKFTRMVPNATY